MKKELNLFELIDEQPVEINNDRLFELEKVVLLHELHLNYFYARGVYSCNTDIQKCSGVGKDKKQAFLNCLNKLLNNYIQNKAWDGEDSIYFCVKCLVATWNGKCDNIPKGMGTCLHHEQVFYTDDYDKEYEQCYQYCNLKKHEVKDKECDSCDCYICGFTE